VKKVWLYILLQLFRHKNVQNGGKFNKVEQQTTQQAKSK